MGGGKGCVLLCREASYPMGGGWEGVCFNMQGNFIPHGCVCVNGCVVICSVTSYPMGGGWEEVCCSVQWNLVPLGRGWEGVCCSMELTLVNLTLCSHQTVGQMTGSNMATDHLNMLDLTIDLP